MAASFWTNPLFRGGNNRDEDDILNGKVSKCSNMAELVQGIQCDLDKFLELEAMRRISSSSNNNNNDATNNDTSDEKKTKNNRGEEDTDTTTLLQTHRDCLAARLARIKTLLYEDGGNDSSKDNTNSPSKLVEGLTRALIVQPNLLPKLLTNLSSPSMPFESRKDLSAIFNNLMVRHKTTTTTTLSTASHDRAGGNAFAEYVLEKYDEILTPILVGHGEAPDIALHCGAMLRSTLRHRALYQQLLSTTIMSTLPSSSSSGGDEGAAAKGGTVSSSPAERYVYPLLDTYVHLPNFDVASDVLATLRDILLTDRAIAGDFLERDYDAFFPKYNKSLQSENYITRRMSLKLLVEILLDRTNFNVMMKYISCKDNLRIVMLLLSDPSPNIQFEAFHVFKIFVANPNKPEDIIKILQKNQEKLVKYLQNFHVERERGDEQFREEKSLIITTLNGLE